MSRTRIILASTSPRRKELFALLGLPFHTVESGYEEDMTLPLPPKELARVLSRGKAEAVTKRYPEAVVLAADTFIVFRNHRLGKPHTPTEARRMLKLLRGKTHLVITGYCIIDGRTRHHVQGTVETRVVMDRYTDRDIRWYVGTGEPLNKAGAYAIQLKGAVLIKKIEGDFFNVMGLPISTISQALKKLGLRH